MLDSNQIPGQPPAGKTSNFDLDSPRFFSRALPALGLMVGIFFILALFLAGFFGSSASHFTGADLYLVSQAEKDPCHANQSSLELIQDGEIFIPIGKDPINVIVSLTKSSETGHLVLVLDSGVDAAQLTRCFNEGAQNAQAAGDMLPFSVREIAAEDIAFSLSPSTAPALFHLEMVQDAAISQKLLIMERGEFEKQSTMRLQIRLLAYGAVGIMILYNLALSFFAGNSAFAFNAGVSASMLLLDVYLSGFGPAYIWPEKPWLSQPFLALGLAGPSLFGPFYLSEFMSKDEDYRLRKRDLLWPGLAAIFLFSAIFIAEVPSLLVLTATWICMTIYYAWRFFNLYRSGNERASVLMFPLFGAVVPAMIAGSLDSWLQPDFGILQDHLTELALVLEALCFTLALAFLVRLSRWREAQALQTLNLQAQHAKQTLLQTLDADRTRMASELHDTAGQGLLLVISRLKQLRSKDTQIDEITMAASRTLNDLRTLSHDLHPSTLDQLGLERALMAMVDHAQASSDLQIAAQIDLGNIALAPANELHVYRIVQELLTNAIVHSKGACITVVAKATDDEVTLMVEDDGPKPPRIDGTSGIGTTIIRERIQALKGKIWSAWSDQGMKVEARIPINPSELEKTGT